MIKKYRNRIILFGVITVALIFMGYYLYANIMSSNKRMARLKNEGTLVAAEMIKLDNVVYDEEPHIWGYDIPGVGESKLDGATITRYTPAQAEEMGMKVEVYYYTDGEELVTFDKDYTDAFRPWVPSQGIFLWSLAGISFLVAAYYIARNIMVVCILRKGEESIGMFIEATHTALGSNKYFKVKYSFVRDGEPVTVFSPPYYTGTEVDKLKDYGSFRVRYIGKYSVIDQKL